MKVTWEWIKRCVRSSLIALVLVAISFGYVDSPPLHNIPALASPSSISAVLTSKPHETGSQASPIAAWSHRSSKSPSGAASNQAMQVPVADAVLEMLAQVNRSRVVTDLMQLTGEVPVIDKRFHHVISNRLTGSEKLDWAQDYVNEKLSRLGYSIERFRWSSSGYTDDNIIARKTGLSLPNEQIYFVAHMDGIKTIGQEHFPAADDNGSGVVDLLELARVLDDYSFDRTVVLFFSTGEEQGAQGVKSYINQLRPEELSSIKYVVNIDMIGYDANQDGVMELAHGGHVPSLDLAQQFSDTIKDYQINLAPEILPGCG